MFMSNQDRFFLLDHHRNFNQDYNILVWSKVVHFMNIQDYIINYIEQKRIDSIRVQ